jgi:hypothetical protein
MKPALSLVAFCALVFILPARPAPAAEPNPTSPGIPSDAKPFNGKWYRVYLERIPWNVAMQRCVALGGQLAVVPDEPTWAFIRSLVKDDSLWLGATDKETEGVWKWVDGTPVVFRAWLPRQPDNSGGNENYLSAFNGGWNDVEIKGRGRVIGFVCEWTNSPGHTKAVPTPGSGEANITAAEANQTSLERALISHPWQWWTTPGGLQANNVHFLPDGTVGMPKWGVVYKWIVTGPRTFTLVIKDKGSKLTGKENISSFTFDESFTRFEGHDPWLPHRQMVFTGIRSDTTNAAAKEKEPVPPAPQPTPVPPASTAVKQEEPARADQSAIELLSKQGLNAMNWAFAPLERAVPPDVRENLIFLKESLLDSAAKGPAANPAACNLGARYCDALIAVLAERDATLARAGASAVVTRSADLGAHRRDFDTDPKHLQFLYNSNWPVYERELHEEATRKEAVAHDQDFFAQRANVQWMERAAQLRRNAELLYGQFRAAVRQTVAPK